MPQRRCPSWYVGGWCSQGLCGGAVRIPIASAGRSGLVLGRGSLRACWSVRAVVRGAGEGE
eukprot:395416-Prymnesium_polylepis.2